MTAEVIDLNLITKVDLPSERILTSALEADLSTVVVIGWDQDNELYFAGSSAYGPENLWLLEMAKTKLIRIGEE
ncbi:hypothetical protein AB0L20_32355 [Streptomyces albidoflavus]|uniref:hypothetical protein n=1 Tax=Streptomyces albidoflavus TaxID=1886 RepID=UPI003429EB4B